MAHPAYEFFDDIRNGDWIPTKKSIQTSNRAHPNSDVRTVVMNEARDAIARQIAMLAH